MSQRIEQELDLLRRQYPDLQYSEADRWILLPRYELPRGVWDRESAQVCFQIPSGYPGNKPYGFYVSPRIKLADGTDPKNCTESQEPPFAGAWLKFSWDPPEWRATADLRTGANVLNWVLTFRARLEQGA